MNHFNVGSLMERGIRLIGCGQAPVQKCRLSSDLLIGAAANKQKDWKEILKWVENGEVDPRIILTHRFKIDDISKGYHMQEKREDGLVKCFIETKFSFPRAEGTPELTHL